jgi:SAM-dependent methyltransferase
VSFHRERRLFHYTTMTPEAALPSVKAKFPFEGYIEPRTDAALDIAHTVQRHLSLGSRILDFGSGPCDKSALLQTLGYHCSACDDLQNDWHQVERYRTQLLAFTQEMGIDFHIVPESDTLPFAPHSFDMVMLHAIIEHLHHSPRGLLNDLLELLKPGGYLFITVPSAVNLRKRLDVLVGRTNLPPYHDFYWSPGPWRGHIREYTHGDLVSLAQYLDLELVSLRGCHHMLTHLPHPALKPLYLALTKLFPGLSDSWSLVAKKPANWTPRRTLPENRIAHIRQAAAQARQAATHE